MPNWRSSKNVLVDEAEHNIGVGTIRSLGRAGYRVTACSSDPHALGFASRFVRETRICPSPSDQSRFLEWLDRTVEELEIDTILGTEGLLAAIRPVYDRYAHLLPYGPDPGVLYNAMAKYQLADGFLDSRAPSRLRDHLPPTLRFVSEDEPPDPSCFRDLPMPLYVKADALNTRGRGRGEVVRVTERSELLRLLPQMRRDYERFLVQGHVPGVGVGAFAVVHDGRILARFMHRRLHEYPHTGGVSSYRQSWWHDRIFADAEARLRYLRWQGPVMLEYRWDPQTDDFRLIEFNCRFWGSLHLALYAGVDFPRIQVDALHGRAPAALPEFPLGVRCRDTFPTEARHVGSRLRDSELTTAQKIWSVMRFVGLTANPRIHADLFFEGDRNLYWIAMSRYLREFGNSLSRRLSSLVHRRTQSWAKT